MPKGVIVAAVICCMVLGAAMIVVGLIVWSIRGPDEAVVAVTGSGAGLVVIPLRGVTGGDEKKKSAAYSWAAKAIPVLVIIGALGGVPIAKDPKGLEVSALEMKEVSARAEQVTDGIESAPAITLEQRVRLTSEAREVKSDIDTLKSKLDNGEISARVFRSRLDKQNDKLRSIRKTAGLDKQ